MAEAHAETLAKTGGCLCGAVRFSTRVEPHMHVCHCGFCRRWSGGAFMAVMTSGLEIENEAALGVYPSSEYGERVFCKTCGSSLFWRMQDGSAAAVSLQALDDPAGVVFEEEIFIDKKPALYAFADGARRLTGYEFFARVAGSQEASQESSGG